MEHEHVTVNQHMLIGPCVNCSNFQYETLPKHRYNFIKFSIFVQYVVIIPLSFLFVLCLVYTHTGFKVNTCNKFKYSWIFFLYNYFFAYIGMTNFSSALQTRETALAWNYKYRAAGRCYELWIQLALLCRHAMAGVGPVFTFAKIDKNQFSCQFLVFRCNLQVLRTFA